MKKGVFKILLMVLVYVAVCLGVYFILKHFGFTSAKKIHSVVDKLGSWAYVGFFVLQITVSTFICIIPLEDEVLTAAAIILFGPLKGFFVAAFNMFVTSSLQFAIGRYLCKDIAVKFLGEKSLEKYGDYLKIKGEIMLPIMYAIPLFPHDTLCVLAGMSKMKYWYFALVSAIMRSIEIACICFLGSGLINYAAFSIADWIIVANIIIIDIVMLCKLQKFIENRIENRVEKR